MALINQNLNTTSILKQETLHAIADILGNGYKCYVNNSTQEVLTAENVSLEDQKSGDYTEYVPLEGPVMFGFMQDYIQNVDDFEKQSELLEAISFEHPFKNFKTRIYSTGLADEWIAYRTEKIAKEIA